MIQRTAPEVSRIAEALHARQRFVISSHTRPDGDSIGSQLAMAAALRALGKDVRVVNRDSAPAPFLAFPGVSDIEIADTFEGDADAAIIMECATLDRTGVAGLDHQFVINIDHHQGNTDYGRLNWFDDSAAACGEMVFDLIGALGIPLDREMATHIYVAILTDTGSFHFSNISPKTFEICRQTLQAGVDPVHVARAVFDSHGMGRLRLYAAALGAMQVAPSGRIATLYLDQRILDGARGSYDDAEGLINEPLRVKDVLAVIFFKHLEGDRYRVSLRSKGQVDVAAVAAEFSGGGHKNAAGCTVSGSLASLRELFREKVEAAIAREDGRPSDRR